MEYLSVHDISCKWKMKERKVTSLCRENRIPGVRKEGNTWLIPSNAIIPLDKRTKDYETKLEEDRLITPYSNISSDEKVIKYYKNKYKKNPVYISFTPYRICLLGSYTESNLGKTLSLALDKGIHIAYNLKTNGIVELESLQYPKRAQWHVLETPEEPQNDWADYLRGANIALNKRFPLKYGLSAVIDGELPISGLSSSNIMITAFVSALASLNNITLTKEMLIEIAKEAEKAYDVLPNKELDQSCEVYAKKDNLLYMNMENNSYELIENPKNMKDYVIGVFFSGINKIPKIDFYNTRVDELRSTAYILKAFDNMEYDRFENTNMIDIPYEVFQKHQNKLPKVFSKRVTYWYEELNRVEKGKKAYKSGNVSEFGKLMNESSESSMINLEIGTKELKSLYEILKNTEGVFGISVAPSGFDGCCIAIMNSKYQKDILDKVKNEYLELYPNLMNKYSSHICHTSDGIRL